jgi:hypothetical protein
MADKKNGYLFPEFEPAVKKPKRKKSQTKNQVQSAQKNIQATKEKQERLKIIKGIANSNVAWAEEVLIQNLQDPSEDIRDFIVKELGTREKLDLKQLYQRINCPPWYVKTGCLQILGLRKNPSSVKYIEFLIDDPNIEVRRTLAFVLGEIGGKKALSLLGLLAKDRSSFVRAAAQQALKKTSNVKFS